VVLLGACASSAPAPQDSFYRIAPRVAVTSGVPVFDGTLMVNRFEAQGFTGSRNIVFVDQVAPLQVQRYYYHLWVESPVLTISDLLASSLRRANVAQHVITPAERAIADAMIGGRLVRLEHRPDAKPPSVLVELELSLIDAERRRPRFFKDYRIEEPAESRSIDDAVAAFDRALARLLKDIVGDLRAALAQSGPSS
jgi:cholesterol transport system auxiliary component